MSAADQNWSAACSMGIEDRGVESRMRSPTVLIACMFLAVLCPSVVCADEPRDTLNIKQDDFALARKTLRQAAEAAVRVKDPIHRVYGLSWIAVSQSKVEDVPGALKTAAKIGDPRKTVLTMADIASAQAKLGRDGESAKTFLHAHKRAASLKEKWDQGYAFGKIAEQEANSHNADAEKTFAEAIQIATTLPKDHEKAGLLFYIGASQLDSGQVQAAATFRESSRFLSTVEDDFRKWMTAVQLAPFQIRAGDDEGALATASYLTDQGDRHHKSQVLSSVASAQAQRGNVEAALKTSSTIEDETEKENAWRWIVEAQLQQGNVLEAVHLTETFQTNWSAKTLALISIAIAQEKAGNAAEAEQSIGQAMNLFQKGVSDSQQESWWSQPFVGALVKAVRLKKAAEAAVIIKSQLVKPYALSMVAEAYGKAGDRGTAEKLLEQAIESGMNSNSMERIAVAYAQIGDVPTALKTARKIPRESDRSYALQRIADVQTQQGHARDALKWAGSLKSPYLKSSALLGVALGILQKHGIEPGTSV